MFDPTPNQQSSQSIQLDGRPEFNSPAVANINDNDSETADLLSLIQSPEQQSSDSIVAYARPIQEVEAETKSNSPFRGTSTNALLARSNAVIKTRQISHEPAIGWQAIVVGIWLFGAATALIIVWIRMLLFVRWLNRCRSVDCPVASRTLRQLCDEIEL